MYSPPIGYKVAKMKKSWNKASILFLLLVSCLSIPKEAAARSDAELQPNFAAERWVVGKIVEGSIADLSIAFPNEKDRVIRASVITDLMERTNSVNINRHGITVRNATVVGNLIFEDKEVDFPLILEKNVFENFFSLCRSSFHRNLALTGSTFKGEAYLCDVRVEHSLLVSNAIFWNTADFTAARVQGNFNIAESQFLSKDKKAIFAGIRVGDNMFAQNAYFVGPAVFIFSFIEGSMVGDGMVFSNQTEAANFNSMEVTATIYLNRSVFSGAADFRDMVVQHHVMMDNAQFLSEEGLAGFEHLQVGGSIYLTHTSFNGPVTFKDAKVGVDFVADETEFRNKTIGVDLQYLEVGKLLSLQKASFDGPASFIYMNVGKAIVANDTRFTSVQGPVSFGEIVVGEHVFLNRATFAGGADFRYAKITKNLELTDTQFRSLKESAFFKYAQIGESLFLEHAIFSGPVVFQDIETGQYIFAKQSQFTNASLTADFSMMKIGKSAFFEGSTFEGGANFNYSEIGYDFNIDRANFKNTKSVVSFAVMRVGSSFFLREVVCEGPASFIYTEIGDTLTATDTQFNAVDQEVSFTNTRVGSYIYLDRSKFNGAVRFLDATTHGFYASNVKWPEHPNGVNFTGFHYFNLDVWDSKDAKWSFLSLIEQSPYSGVSYQMLEDYYRREGYPDSADTVYVAHKLREQREGLLFQSPRWWWSWFMSVFAFYGQNPIRAFLWLFLFVAAGHAVFHRQETMMCIRETKRSYNSFLFSLDLFLPISNLGYKRIWIPKPEHKFSWVYYWFHRSIAWFLIPAAILIVSGIIK